MAGLERCPEHSTFYVKGCEGCQTYRREYQRQMRQAKKLRELADKRAQVDRMTRRPVETLNDPYRRVEIVEGDLSWHAQAACRNAPTDVFFPESEGRGKAMAWSLALAVCDSCPVTEPCLTYALRTNQRDGVWGGKTPRQRSRLPKPDPICADCGEEFPKPANGSKDRCDECQRKWRRRRQYEWHHQVGKFKEVAS